MHICKYTHNTCSQGVSPRSCYQCVSQETVWGPHTSFPWKGCGPRRDFKAPVGPDLPSLVTRMQADTPQEPSTLCQGPGKRGHRPAQLGRWAHREQQEMQG